MPHPRLGQISGPPHHA